MKKWTIKNRTNRNERTAYASTFAEACRDLGWNAYDCYTIECYSLR
jgi:hypothetical protein